MELLSDHIDTRENGFEFFMFQRLPSGLASDDRRMGTHACMCHHPQHVLTEMQISEDFDQLVLFLLVYRRREGFCRAEDGACHLRLQGNRATSPVPADLCFLQRRHSSVMTRCLRYDSACYSSAFAWPYPRDEEVGELQQIHASQLFFMFIP